MNIYQLLFLFGLLIPVPLAQAVNSYFLGDAPIASFTAGDVALMEENLQNSLEHLADGEKSAWKNDTSGNSGLAQPVKSYEKDGKRCRSLRLINRSKKSINESTYEFCKEQDSWKLVM